MCIRDSASLVHRDDGAGVDVSVRAARLLHQGQVATLDHRLLGATTQEIHALPGRADGSSAHGRVARLHNDAIDFDRRTCAVCGRTADLLCGRCRAVRFCSTACQRKHWNAGHKDECRSEEVPQPE